MKDYLGKIVTNYKGTSGTEAPTGYTVSKVYRLFYVDFDNKYGDGKGTIYLKADNINSKYTIPLDSNSAADYSVKIKQFNPALYRQGVKSPSAGNTNMQAVTWLLNTENWDKLKETGDSTELKNYVNYVVGAPSIEIFIDSYNVKYGLTGSEPVLDGPDSPAKPLAKLYYKFDTGNVGYRFGPGIVEPWSGFAGSYKLPLNDAELYYPSGGMYALASPEFEDSRQVVMVYTNGGTGFAIHRNFPTDAKGLTPMVSLKPNAPIKLQIN